MENKNETESVKMIPESSDEYHEQEVIKTENINENEKDISINSDDNDIVEKEVEYDTNGIYTLSDEETDDNFISLPTLPSNALLEYIKNSSTIKEETYVKDINTSHAVLTNLNSIPFTVSEEYFKNIKFNNNRYKPNMEYNGKKIQYEEVKLQSSDKKLKAIDRVRSITRIGKNIQIPLWNTGIRVTISVPPINSLYDLKKKLRDLNIEIDTDTGGLLFSNKKIKLYKEILDFISVYILDTTLEIPEDKTLFDYIKVQDIALLIIGISLSLYPNGNNITIACFKTTEIKQGKPSCNFVTSAKIDPKELVKIDTDRVTDKMLEIISRRNSNSVTIEDLETYQNEFILNKNQNINIEYDIGNLLFNLLNPDINKFISKGGLWYDDIIEKLYGIGNLIENNKKEELEKLIELNLLGSYNSYVNNIVIDDEILEDDDIIFETLNEVTQDNYLYNIFIKEIIEFISYNTIANIGTNNFLCPSCNNKQKTEKTSNKFEMEYVWLDPLSYFLEIMNSKLIKMQKRTIS